MSFVRTIAQDTRFGSITVASLTIPLEVLRADGVKASQNFLFDTGCQITTVSEDVAAALGLPPDDGTRRVRVTGASGKTAGRLMDVTFRFPTTVSGTPGLEVSSTWVVAGGQSNLALLGFQEVHRHFSVKTYEFDVYFVPWQALTGR
jgi:predicted aspartyl protease